MYVAKYYQSEKGIMLEGFRYRKMLNDKHEVIYDGVYCKYFVKQGNYDNDFVQVSILDHKPLVLDYDENLKSFLVKNEGQI